MVLTKYVSAQYMDNAGYLLNTSEDGNLYAVLYVPVRIWLLLLRVLLHYIYFFFQIKIPVQNIFEESVLEHVYFIRLGSDPWIRNNIQVFQMIVTFLTLGFCDLFCDLFCFFCTFLNVRVRLLQEFISYFRLSLSAFFYTLTNLNIFFFFD